MPWLFRRKTKEADLPIDLPITIKHVTFVDFDGTLENGTRLRSEVTKIIDSNNKKYEEHSCYIFSAMWMETTRAEIETLDQQVITRVDAREQLQKMLGKKVLIATNADAIEGKEIGDTYEKAHIPITTHCSKNKNLELTDHGPYIAIRCTHFISLKANPRIEAQIFAIHVT